MELTESGIDNILQIVSKIAGETHNLEVIDVCEIIIDAHLLIRECK